MESGRKMECCGRTQRVNRRKVCLCGCGSCCLLAAVLTVVFWSAIFLSFLSGQFGLSRNSITYNMWRETPLPMYMNVVLFNWTNPERSLRGPDKPAFTEMGPYVFSEHHSKQHIEWNDDNGTITFLNRNEWHFQPDMSSGRLTDLITNVNPVAMILGSRCYDLGNNVSSTVDDIFKKEGSLVVSKTAEELIFGGFEDKLLHNKELKCYLPEFPEYNRFGWYYQRNMSETFDGAVTMYTGDSDIEKLGLLTAWNYQTSTGCYPGECGRVHATIGDVLPLSTFKQDHFELFNTDICGVYTLDLEKLVDLNEIPGVQFRANSSFFDNSQTCYCPEKSCPPPGVRDISACKKAPLFVSLPHFLYADHSYLDAVTGLKPDEIKHSLFMSLANLTSVPLVVRVRLQTNLLMEPVPNMTFFAGVNRVYMPMLWLDQFAILTPELASLMHPLYPLARWGGWVTLALEGGLGIFLLVLGVVLRCQD